MTQNGGERWKVTNKNGVPSAEVFSTFFSRRHMKKDARSKTGRALAKFICKFILRLFILGQDSLRPLCLLSLRSNRGWDFQTTPSANYQSRGLS